MSDTQLFVNLCLSIRAQANTATEYRWASMREAQAAVEYKFGHVDGEDVAWLAALAVCSEEGVWDGMLDDPRRVDGLRAEALLRLTLERPEVVSAAREAVRSAMDRPSMAHAMDAISRAAADRGVHIETVSIKHTTERRTDTVVTTTVCDHCGLNTAADLRAAENILRRETRRGDR